MARKQQVLQLELQNTLFVTDPSEVFSDLAPLSAGRCHSHVPSKTVADK